MPTTGYSNVGNYQFNWAFLTADPTVDDNDITTGPTSPFPSAQAITAGIDLGGTVGVTDISFTVGYGDNSPSIILEWSTNSTTWSTVGIPTLSPPAHGGTFSLWSPSFSGLSITAAYLRLSIHDPSSTCSVRELDIPAAAITETLTGQSLVVSRGYLSSPIDGYGELSGQATSAMIGAAVSQPTITLLGQVCHAAQSYIAGPSDEVVLITGQACPVALGSVAGAKTAFLTGQSLNVLSSAVSSGPDKFANLSGQNVTVGIECYKDVVAVTGPHEVTYTLFDTGGSHDILGPAGNLSTITLTFSLALVTMNPGDHATMDGADNSGRFRFYADAPLPLPSGFSLSPPGTDFDGLSIPHSNPDKYYRVGFAPTAIFDPFGNFLYFLQGPYSYDIGFYTDFSKLVYDNQGGSFSVTLTTEQYPGNGPCRLYCAYIKIIVSSLNPKSVPLQAETFKGILNVLWVSGGPPGKLKFATHLAPAKHIGNSTVGWEATQEIESTASCTACGMVYLPNGRLYICYRGESVFSRINDMRGAGDVSGWSARHEADRDHISAGGTGQLQAWRFVAGAADSADDILFSQCRDVRGEGWTSVTETITAVSAIARGPLCGGCWLGNRYGLLYTRNSDGEIFFKTAADPSDWSGSPLDTGFAGNVCGLAQHPSGRLVGLMQAGSGGAVKALISDDRGMTWAQSSALSITPTPPPVIVCDEGGILFAVYIESDAPKFCASVDGGSTWV